MRLINMIRLAFCVLSLGLLTSCHTVKGLGQDISAGGQALAHSAEQHSHQDNTSTR